MKSSEKKGLLILIGVALIVILVIWLCTRPKDNNTQTAEQTSPVQGEFTTTDTDGTIVNTSEKLKEEKTESGFKISNITFTDKDGHTVLKATVTNKTGANQGEFMADIVLLDKSGNEIGRIPVSVPETKAGESIGVQAGINDSYANAYNFKLEKR